MPLTSFGARISELLPDFTVTEHRGRVSPARGTEPAGRVEITYSGGLAHLYFANLGGRLDEAALEARFPGLVAQVAAIQGVGLVMLKGTSGGALVDGTGRYPLEAPLADATRRRLEPFDEPEVLAAQLRRLNSFERSGDLIIFGSYDGATQANFEDQVGGHGSIGGDQLHPFVLAKTEWSWDLSRVTNSSELYPLLMALRRERS